MTSKEKFDSFKIFLLANTNMKVVLEILFSHLAERTNDLSRKSFYGGVI